MCQFWGQEYLKPVGLAVQAGSGSPLDIEELQPPFLWSSVHLVVLHLGISLPFICSLPVSLGSQVVISMRVVVGLLAS